MTPPTLPRVRLSHKKTRKKSMRMNIERSIRHVFHGHGIKGSNI